MLKEIFYRAACIVFKPLLSSLTPSFPLLTPVLGGLSHLFPLSLQSSPLLSFSKITLILCTGKLHVFGRNFLCSSVVNYSKVNNMSCTVHDICRQYILTFSCLPNSVAHLTWLCYVEANNLWILTASKTGFFFLFFRVSGIVIWDFLVLYLHMFRMVEKIFV